jgi:hypothetical protein
MYIDIVLMCVDCVLASPRIAQTGPGWRTPPWDRSVAGGSGRHVRLVGEHALARAAPVALTRVARDRGGGSGWGERKGRGSRWQVGPPGTVTGGSGGFDSKSKFKQIALKFKSFQILTDPKKTFLSSKIWNKIWFWRFWWEEQLFLLELYLKLHGFQIRAKTPLQIWNSIARYLGNLVQLLQFHHCPNLDKEWSMGSIKFVLWYSWHAYIISQY